MLFCEFLVVFVVEMYFNEFEKDAMVRIHLNSSQKALTRDVLFGFKFSRIQGFTNFSDSTVTDSCSICDNFVSDSCSFV